MLTSSPRACSPRRLLGDDQPSFTSSSLTASKLESGVGLPDESRTFTSILAVAATAGLPSTYVSCNKRQLVLQRPALSESRESYSYAAKPVTILLCPGNPGPQSLHAPLVAFQHMRTSYMIGSAAVQSSQIEFGCRGASRQRYLSALGTV
jgi:hypothetical protein